MALSSTYVAPFVYPPRSDVNSTRYRIMVKAGPTYYEPHPTLPTFTFKAIAEAEASKLAGPTRVDAVRAERSDLEAEYAKVMERAGIPMPQPLPAKKLCVTGCGDVAVRNGFCDVHASEIEADIDFDGLPRPTAMRGRINYGSDVDPFGGRQNEQAE